MIVSQHYINFKDIYLGLESLLDYLNTFVALDEQRYHANKRIFESLWRVDKGNCLDYLKKINVRCIEEINILHTLTLNEFKKIQKEFDVDMMINIYIDLLRSFTHGDKLDWLQDESFNNEYVTLKNNILTIVNSLHNKFGIDKRDFLINYLNTSKRFM